MAARKQSPEEMLAALAEEDSESDDEDLLQPERRRDSHHDVPPSERYVFSLVHYLLIWCKTGGPNCFHRGPHADRYTKGRSEVYCLVG